MPKQMKDLTGQRFNMLTVMSFDKKEKGKLYWNCLCDCGRQKSVRADLLKGEVIKDCGCVFKNSDKTILESCVGQKFGRLVVEEDIIERYENNRIKRLYKCKCECGNTKVCGRQDLLNGKVTQCDMCTKSNTYDLDSHDYGIGYTTLGEEFYFDKEDYDLIKPYRWYLFTKDDNNDGYVRAHTDDGEIFMHNLVMGERLKRDIDHDNGIRRDNRKSNLRHATRGENNINRKPTKRNKSGVTGVCYVTRVQKWKASICKDGVSYMLGHFENFEDAVQARRKAEVELFGEFSPTYEEYKNELQKTD